MHPVLEDFQTLMRQAVLARVPQGAEAELSVVPFDRLVQVYLNWLGRLVPPRPRTVHLSNGLFSDVDDPAVREALDRLLDKIREGGDLRPHLSREVRFAYRSDPCPAPVGDATAGARSGPVAGGRAPRGRGRTRPDLDRLLAEWGIHHLHPGLPSDPEGTVTRGSLLLFAHFTATDAYLIAVLPHRRWTDLDMVRTCVRTWPDAGIFTRSRVATGLEPGWDSDDTGERERKELRDAGVTSLLEVDGAVYVPPGQTIGGLPLSAVEAANGLQHALWLLDAELSGPNPAGLIGEDAARLAGAEPRWEAVRNGPLWQVREGRTGVPVLSCAFTL